MRNCQKQTWFPSTSLRKRSKQILITLLMLLSFLSIEAANVMVLESKKMIVDVKTTKKGKKVIIEKKDGSKEEYDADKIKIFPVPTTWGDDKEKEKKELEKVREKAEGDKKEKKPKKKKKRDKLSMILMGVWAVLWLVIP